jgi:HlyD family secretion protein
MKKAIVFILSASVLIAVSILLYRIFEKKEKSNEIILYGNVDVRQVDIGFRVAGRVVKLCFEEGDFVPEGSLMAVLDQSPYDSQVVQAEANLASIEANLENANSLLDRRAVAVNFGGVSQQDLDNALASRDELFSQQEAAKAALQVAIDNMEYTEVYAPTDGIILSRVREPGTVVNPTDPIYVLSVCSPIWIRAYVDEPQLGLIYYGMKAEVHTDSGNTYSGKIGFISPMAEFTPKTVETAQLRTDLVYRLRIYIDHPDQFLKQGMPVTVQLHRSLSVQEPDHTGKK